jgi:hypothetical protein
MGKKSLTKSTTKKKTTAPKKSETPKKSEAPKKQIGAPAQKPAAPPKKAKPAAPKKTIKTEKPTITSLLKKDFGTWSPESRHAETADPADSNNYTAPAFIDETNPVQAQRIKNLIGKEFDLTVPDAPEKSETDVKPEEKTPRADETPVEKHEIQEPPVLVKSEPLPIAVLLNLKFDDWKPPVLFMPVPDENYLKGFSAPPFIETTDPKEIERIRALLSKTIDLTAIETEETSEAKKNEMPAEVKQPVVEAPKPVAPPEVKEPALEPVKAKEEPTETAPPKRQEDAQAAEPPKTPEKPALQPPPKEVAPKIEPPKSSAPAPKPPEKEADSVKPLAWIEQKKSVDVFDKGLKLLAGGIALFFALLFFASAINSGKYYLMPSEAGLEIWKGKFSPSGKQPMMTVPGVELTEPLKKSYTKAEALSPAFNHYLRQADELSGVKGTPDFEAIKIQLNSALDVAPTQNDRDMALKRLNTIDFTFLLFKANTASRKKTPENIEKALGFLNEAKALDLDDTQRETLEKKINELKPPVTPEISDQDPKTQKSSGQKSGKH